jgi:secondary thiamine-phosphate synthase enzyme
VVVDTQGRGFLNITPLVAQVVTQTGHADTDVLRDLEDWFARAVPDGDERYRHRTEGPDDMPAHIRAALTQPSLAIPVVEGRLGLGQWQAIYLYEHRKQGHRRRMVVTVQD